MNDPQLKKITIEDLRPLKLTEITEDVWLVRDDISSMEFEKSYGDYYGQGAKNGTTITLKNGRKIYLAGMKPAYIMAKLEGK